MQGDVETFLLDVLRHPQANAILMTMRMIERHDGVIDDDDGDARCIWLMTWPALPSIRPAVPPYCSIANTPVSIAPMMPPTACTPKQSSASS